MKELNKKTCYEESLAGNSFSPLLNFLITGYQIVSYDQALRLMQFRSSKAISSLLEKLSSALRSHTLGS